MSNITFIRKMRELRHCMPKSVVESMEWVEGGREPQYKLRDFKHRVAARVINNMIGYIVDRVADGDICLLPDKDETMIYMGYNYPIAVEKMRRSASYPYKEGVMPGFIKVSSAKNPRTYLSLLMSKEKREWLIDKINEGREYYQPIPLHATYHLERKGEELAAWDRISKEQEWATLTWTI